MPNQTYGLTLNTQTDEPMTLHDVECSLFKNATKTRRLTEEEAVAWTSEHPRSVHRKCVQEDDLPAVASRSGDEVVHIIWPASKAKELTNGKRVQAVCGKYLTAPPAPRVPVCRDCFDTHFFK